MCALPGAEPMRSFFAAATVGLGLASCHQPELPPVGPTPTNPINAASVAFQRRPRLDGAFPLAAGLAFDATGHRIGKVTRAGEAR
jgi:hypothetical protein